MDIETSEMKSFDYTVERVVASKMEFVVDGGSFLYLRKGEASGAVEVATYALGLLGPGILDAADLLAQIGMGAAAAAGGIAAFNKAWEFGLEQLEKFFSNIDRLKEVSGKLRGRIEKSEAPKNSVQVLPVPADMRIICTRNEENERAIPLLRALGARLRHRPSTLNPGTHRYHVNEFRFALHFRASGSRFIGVTGSDPLMRAYLKSDFLEEWERCGDDIVA